MFRRGGRSFTIVGDMVGSIRDGQAHLQVTVRAVVIGVALGIVIASAAALLVIGGTSLVREATGLTATALVALAVGIWAGAPGASRDELPSRERWATAGVATAGAGACATALRLFGYVPAGGMERTATLLALAAVPIYTLGMALPVVLAWGERRDPADDGDGDWGALGAVLIGVLGGMVLGVLAGGLLLIPWVGAGPILLAVSVLLLTPLVVGEPDEPEPEEVVLYDGSTPFASIRVTERDRPGEGQPERRLYLNGEEESAELVRSGAPALAYVAAAEIWLASSTPRGSAYLFLGGGAYTLPRRVAERDPRARISVVELDPEVTRVAYEYFGIRPEHRIVSVHGDARAFVEQRGETGTYDRVYLDVYSGHEALPYALVTREAFSALRRVLRPGGAVAMNVIGTVVGDESPRFWSIVSTFASVFPSVALYPHLGTDYPDRQNLLLAGAPEVGHAFSPRAGLFDQWPRERWPEEPAAAVFRDIFPAAENGPSGGTPAGPPEPERSPRAPEHSLFPDAER